MESIPIPRTKAEITELIGRTQRGRTDYTFTVNGRPAAVLMSVTRYESLMETLNVLSDPEARADLAESNDSDQTTEEEMVELLRHRFGGGRLMSP